MADDGRFFGEADPEWAISQLAAVSAPGPVRPRRRLPWLMVAGGVATTALVAGAFLLGGAHETEADRPPAPVVAAKEPTELSAVAPRATLAAVLRPRRKPAPAADAQPQVYVAPTPVAPQPVRKPGRPSNQVGPNKPIKSPIDPDDR
jgi:hypothetical protein